MYLTPRANMVAKLRWKSPAATHEDLTYIANVNFWRDDFPPGLREPFHRFTNTSASVRFNAGVLYPTGDTPVIEIPKHSIKARHQQDTTLHPGRYYPKGLFAGHNGIIPGDMVPVRLIQETDKSYAVRVDHPMAAIPLELQASITDILPAREEHGGAINDIAALAGDAGPGMQAWPDNPQQAYLTPDAFDRVNKEPDFAFYQKPRMVHHLDSTARQHITELYAGLLHPKGKVLDLMGSWDSHLPTHKQYSVVGLGLNKQELQANRALFHYVIHDVNRHRQLPFQDNHFDAVICTSSVEYMCQPVGIFSEVARILKPHGVFIITYSRRWFPEKVIRLWTELHPYETLGVVTWYFHQTGAYHDIHTLSVRGYPKPVQDKFANSHGLADDVFAAWAYAKP